jgi:hypothetical protein
MCRQTLQERWGDQMNVSVKAIRDADGTVLGETIFDISNRSDRSKALADLLNEIYAAAPDPLELPPFTFKFDLT